LEISTKGLKMRKLIFISIIAGLGSFVPPSAANAWSWWSGWESFQECYDYYTTHDPGYAHKVFGGISYKLTRESVCSGIRYEEYRKSHAMEEIERVIKLGCQADSITQAQYAACMALSLPQGR
jgi:hypothetical protein